MESATVGTVRGKPQSDGGQEITVDCAANISVPVCFFFFFPPSLLIVAPCCCVLLVINVWLFVESHPECWDSKVNGQCTRGHATAAHARRMRAARQRFSVRYQVKVELQIPIQYRCLLRKLYNLATSNCDAKAQTTLFCSRMSKNSWWPLNIVPLSCLHNRSCSP